MLFKLRVIKSIGWVTTTIEKIRAKMPERYHDKDMCCGHIFQGSVLSGLFCKCITLAALLKGLRATIKALRKVHTVGAQTVVSDIF